MSYQRCKQKAYTSLTLFVRKVYTFCKPPLYFGLSRCSLEEGDEHVRIMKLLHRSALPAAGIQKFDEYPSVTGIGKADDGKRFSS